MEKDMTLKIYELILEGYTRHLEGEEEVARRTKAWLDKRHDYEQAISSLIYDGKVWEKE